MEVKKVKDKRFPVELFASGQRLRFTRPAAIELRNRLQEIYPNKG